MPIAQNLDFLNLNSLRAFPLKQGVSRLSTDGVFTIPDTFLVDLTLSASSNVTDRFYISKVQNTPDVIVVTVSDQLNVVAGTFTIIVADHLAETAYYMAPSAAYVGANAKLIVGDLLEMITAPSGLFLFTLATAEFEDRCVVPAIATVNRLVFLDEKGTRHTVSGDVVILARNNLRFRQVSGVIVLDAGDGIGLNKKCTETLPCIQTIRNVGPDSSGDFNLVGSDCAQFTEMSNPPGLVLQETCCKPCMGCDEVSELTQRTMQVESDLLKLRDFTTNIQLQINTFAQTTNYTCEC